MQGLCFHKTHERKVTLSSQIKRPFDNNQNITHFQDLLAHYHKNKNIQRRRSELNTRAKLTKEFFLP